MTNVVSYTVAILGASGAVGQEMLQLLDERSFPIGELRLLASARSAGRRIPFKGEDITIREVSKEAFQGVDIAFFCAAGEVSRRWVSEATSQGVFVVDNTSAFRLDVDVPLVIPEVNGEAIKNHRGIVANANCSTIILAMAIAPIHRAVGIKRVIVSTYQAVSGAGVKGMEELEDQLKAWVEERPIEASVLPVSSGPHYHQIAMNVIPQIDQWGESGYSKEEWKMVHETRKILDEPDLLISPTTVRVPVMRSHSESVTIETERKVSVDEVRTLLAEAEGIQLIDDIDKQEYPMPLMTSGKDDIFVGRIREDLSHDHGINLWVVGDQIRKGAALNAVQIAEYAYKHDLLRV